jgi:pectate lyase
MSRVAGLKMWLGAAVAIICLGLVAHADVPSYEGFGAVTTGGQGYSLVHVTSLADSGPGTLREALSAGNRTVVFDVAGDIVLSDFLYVNGPFVTIDGFTAPAPGITLRARGLVIRGTHGAHDVIVRGLRVRDSTIDGIQIAYGAAAIVIDHCSIFGSGDGNLDITEDSHDVTVSWTILARPKPPQKNMLIKYRASRITLHHNLFMASQRNPLASIDDNGTVPASDTTLDMRNNLVWNWGSGSGTMIKNHAEANVVGNFYGSLSSSLPGRVGALTVCPAVCIGLRGAPGRAYVAGNFNFLGPDVNDLGTETVPFPAPPVATGDVCVAAQRILAGAGVRPLDTVDAGVLAAIRLPPCAPDLTVASVVPPTITGSGQAIALDFVVANLGPASAGAFDVGFWLSADSMLGAGDRLLARVPVTAVALGGAFHSTVTVTLGSDVAPGVYHVIAIADVDRAVPDSDRANNTTVVWLRVQGADLQINALLSPATIGAGNAFSVTDTTGNGGVVPAPSSSTRFYLSRDTVVGAGDIDLGERVVPPLAAGAASTQQTLLTIPSGTTPGTYYLVAMADAGHAVLERTESNNQRWRSLLVAVH